MKEFWKFVRVALPEAIWSAVMLFLSITFPMVLLAIILKLPPSGVMEIVAVANSVKKISEIVMILLPLGAFYIVTGVVFALSIGKIGGEPDVHTDTFRMLFGLPYAVLVFSEIILTAYLFLTLDVKLGDAQFFWADLFINMSIASLVLLELFMAINRARRPFALHDSAARRTPGQAAVSVTP